MDKQFAPKTEDILLEMRELLVGIYIQQLRIYDVLTLISAKDQPEKTDELVNMHETGKILCPDPALAMDE